MVHIDIQNSYLRDITSHANDKLTSASSGPRQDRRTFRRLVQRLVRSGSFIGSINLTET